MADEGAVKRAVAIIGIAQRGNMAAVGGMPESDKGKLDEAERLVSLSKQAKQVADAVGRSKVPTYPIIRDILLEAQALEGEELEQALAEIQVQGGAQQPSPQPASSPEPQPSQPAPAPSSPAPPPSAAVTAPPSTTPSPEPASSSPTGSPSPGQPEPHEPGGWLYGPQPQEIWATVGAGEWEILKLLEGGMIEAKSCATGESTVLPAAFFTTKVSHGAAPNADVTPPIDPTKLTIVDRPDGAAEFRVPTQAEPESKPAVERIELVIDRPQNSRTYVHPGCSTWVVPDDGAAASALNARVECNECGMPFPLTSIQETPASSDHQPKEEPSSASQSPPPSPAPSSVSPPASTASPTPTSTPSTEQPSPSSSQESPSRPTGSTGAPVDDAEGDDAYAALLDDVDSLFTPSHFPIPHDLEHPPELMPDDLTLGEVENRRLHSQYNALAARARYLWSIDHLKAKRCGRMVKKHMKPAMRRARAGLGKDATVAEVKLVAEEEIEVSKWTARQDFHSDRAEAYKEFFEIYAENVKTLSRDLTYAAAEQEGS